MYVIYVINNVLHKTILWIKTGEPFLNISKSINILNFKVVFFPLLLKWTMVIHKVLTKYKYGFLHPFVWLFQFSIQFTKIPKNPKINQWTFNYFFPKKLNKQPFWNKNHFYTLLLLQISPLTFFLNWCIKGEGV